MSEISINRFEEKIAKRLGEVAILLHLARSPDGSHAYELRIKVSEILFEKRRRGMEFIHNHLEMLNAIKDLVENEEIDSDEFLVRKNALTKKLEKCPVFKYNPHFDNLINRKNREDLITDLNYLTSISNDLEEAIHDIKEMTTVWSSISGIYPAIDSLEKNELIEYIREDSEGGRLKKIYQITDLGRKTLARVVISLADITEFVFHSEDKKIIFSKEEVFTSLLNPFRRVFKKLADDVPSSQRKKMLIISKDSTRKPFTQMFMEHGLPLPSFRFLIRHPSMIKDHLNQIQSEDERELAKEFLRTKLLERKEDIEQILKELN